MRPLFVCAIAVLILVAATFASATEVLDQQNDVSPSATADSTSGGFQEQGQTFTVGVTGTLSRITAQINYPGFGSGGNAILTVYNTSGGVPNASLGTASISNAGIPSGGYAFQSFDVSSYAIPVHVGDVLAYGITSSINTYFFARSTFDHSTYAGGQSYFRAANPAGSWAPYSPSHDLGFQTYVVAGAASIPGDFDGNGKVDAADYVRWRKFLGAPTEAALHGNGNNLNGVDQGDYTLWRAHFGAPPGSGANIGSTSIPEPQSLLLLILGACCCAFGHFANLRTRPRRVGRT